MAFFGFEGSISKSSSSDMRLMGSDGGVLMVAESIVCTGNEAAVSILATSTIDATGSATLVASKSEEFFRFKRLFFSGFGRPSTVGTSRTTLSSPVNETSLAFLRYASMFSLYSAA